MSEIGKMNALMVYHSKRCPECHIADFSSDNSGNHRCACGATFTDENFLPPIASLESQLSTLRKVEAELRRGLAKFADRTRWSSDRCNDVLHGHAGHQCHDLYFNYTGDGYDLAQQTLAAAEQIAKEG